MKPLVTVGRDEFVCSCMEDGKDGTVTHSGPPRWLAIVRLGLLRVVARVCDNHKQNYSHWGKMRRLPLILLFVMSGCAARHAPQVDYTLQGAYYTPEQTCKDGFRKTDWHSQAYPYYIECAPIVTIKTVVRAAPTWEPRSEPRYAVDYPNRGEWRCPSGLALYRENGERAELSYVRDRSAVLRCK